MNTKPIERKELITLQELEIENELEFNNCKKTATKMQTTTCKNIHKHTLIHTKEQIRKKDHTGSSEGSSRNWFIVVKI